MVQLTLYNAIREQLRLVHPVSLADLSGKTVVVVGANAGLGLDATIHFAKMGASRIILACRDATRGKKAAEKVRSVPGFQGTAEVWQLDLSEYASVLAFVEQFERDEGRLDILMLNAAVLADIYEATSDGWETSLQVNCISTALVSLLLIPSLVRTATQHNTKPRLVIVASDVHYFALFDKQTLESESILKTLGSKEYCTSSIMMSRYNVTKLVNVFFTRALAAHIPHTTPLIVNAANPGYCFSQLRKNMKFPMNVVDWILERIFARTTEEGSRMLVYAAVGVPPVEDNMRGAFVSNMEVTEVSDFVLKGQGPEIQEKLWEEMIDVMSKIAPEKVEAVMKGHLV